LVDIIDEAMDLAMVEANCVSLNIDSEIYINADFKLFAIAIKNMIDNGIKYSNERYMKVVADSKSIRFISLGSPLDHPLSHYIEPFVQGNNSVKSLGLGLYIVDNITKAHHLNLAYRHQNGYNIFSFENLEALIGNSVQL
jgi:two-component system OmpR family sensor kinase